MPQLRRGYNCQSQNEGGARARYWMPILPQEHCVVIRILFEGICSLLMAILPAAVMYIVFLGGEVSLVDYGKAYLAAGETYYNDKSILCRE
jgi:hypothetical protein